MTQQATMSTAARIPRIGDRVTFDGELWEIVALGTEEDGMRYAQLATVSRPGLRIGRWISIQT